MEWTKAEVFSNCDDWEDDSSSKRKYKNFCPSILADYQTSKIKNLPITSLMYEKNSKIYK